MREAVELAFSLDTVAITQGTSHIFGAVKNIDPRSQKNRKLIYMGYNKHGNQLFKSLQSNANAYLMIMIYAREVKQPYWNFLKTGCLHK